MEKILITENIRTHEDFFAAIGHSRVCKDKVPQNLEDLENCLKAHDISTVIVANIDMDEETRIPLRKTLKDAGVKVLL